MKALLSTRYTAIAVAMTLLLFSAGISQAAIDLKYGVATGPSHNYNIGAAGIQKAVKDATGGEVNILFYAGGQLASGERELVEGLQFGTVDMCLVSTGPMVVFDPDFMLFTLPYLFSSEEAAYKTVDGPIGKGFASHMEKQGIKVLGWTLGGVWAITNSKRPINTPDDLKGLKIRCMENPMNIDILKSFGAMGTPMSLGEAFTALQQGTVDGQENATASTFANKYYEVQKFMGVTKHLIVPAPLLMSQAKFNSMSPQLQEKFMAGIAEGIKFQRAAYAKQAAEALEGMRKNGVAVTEPDVAPFKALVKPVYDRYLPQLSAQARTWVEQIQSGK